MYLKVARLMSQAIEAGIYAPGSRLPAERELAELYEVSRPVIREAMIVLETRGLVSIRSNGGTFVSSSPSAPPSTVAGSDVGPFEVTEARRLLEGEVAALAASVITDDQIAELEATLAIMEDLSIDESARERADRAFHIALARIVDNEVLLSMVESLWDMRYNSPLCMYFFQRAREHGIQPPADQHRIIIQALRARDVEGSRQAMREHLMKVTNSLLIATETDARERARLRMGERGMTFLQRARAGS